MTRSILLSAAFLKNFSLLRHYEKAKVLHIQVIELLKHVGMILSKWCANQAELLVTEELVSSEFKDQYIHKTVKTLDMLWDPQAIVFRTI